MKFEKRKYLYINHLHQNMLKIIFSIGICLLSFNIYAEKKIIIGIYDDPPAIYMTNGKPDGYFFDIFDNIFHSAGYITEYKYGDWDTICKWLENGKIDTVFDICPTEERKKIYDFNNETVFLSWGVIYGRSDLQVKSLYDLKNLRIAVVKGDIYYEGNNDSLKVVLNALKINPNFVETGGFRDCIEKVKEGKADVCVIPREFADFVLRDDKSFIQTPIIFKPTSVNIAFKKGSGISKELIPLVDKVISNQKSDENSNYYKAINKYTNNSVILKENIVVKEVASVKMILWIVGTTFFSFGILYNFALKKRIKKITFDLIKANEQLKEMANRDYLTGLYNRRIFEELFIRELALSKRYERAISVILIDIDHFKKINDTYGHQVGDIVLKKIAKLFLEKLRVGDIVCRYGGEEFAIFLPETDKENAFIVAEKLRESIENFKFEEISQELNVKITGGISEYKKGFSEDIDKIISMADEALYVGKNSGRNKMVIYGKEQRISQVVDKVYK